MDRSVRVGGPFIRLPPAVGMHVAKASRLWLRGRCRDRHQQAGGVFMSAEWQIEVNANTVRGSSRYLTIVHRSARRNRAHLLPQFCPQHEPAFADIAEDTSPFVPLNAR